MNSIRGNAPLIKDHIRVFSIIHYQDLVHQVFFERKKIGNGQGFPLLRDPG